MLSQNADMRQKKASALAAAPRVQGASLTAVHCAAHVKHQQFADIQSLHIKERLEDHRAIPRSLMFAHFFFFSSPLPRTLFSLVVESALRPLQSYASRVLTLHTSPEASPRLGCSSVIKKNNNNIYEAL